MRRVVLIDFAVFALVGTLAIGQCCIPTLPQAPSHCSHNRPGTNCQGMDEAVVDRTAAVLISTMDVTIDQRCDFKGYLDTTEKAPFGVHSIDVGPPDLFIHTSALLI